jgi:hypothetical protein
MAPTAKRRYACPHCKRVLRNKSGLTQHVHSVHILPAELRRGPEVVEHTPDEETADLPTHNQHRTDRTEYHPHLNGLALSSIE